MRLGILVVVLLLATAPTAMAEKGVKNPAMVWIDAASKARSKSDYKTAIALYTKAIASGHLKGLDLASAYNERGVAQSSKGDKKAAIADFTRAIATLPKQPFYYGNRARTRMVINQPLKAAADFTKVIELRAKPSTYAYFDRCQAYAKAGKRELAKADCRKSVELKPGNGQAARLLKSLEKGK